MIHCQCGRKVREHLIMYENTRYGATSTCKDCGRSYTRVYGEEYDTITMYHKKRKTLNQYEGYDQGDSDE